MYTIDIDMTTDNTVTHKVKSMAYGPEITSRQLAYRPEVTLETV